MDRQNKGNIYHSVIADTEKVLIQRALANSHGNQIAAAQTLGLHRNTLRRKIKELKINLRMFKGK